VKAYRPRRELTRSPDGGRPTGRSHSGYRLHGTTEIRRLGEVLILRELSIDLETIKRMVENPDHDRMSTLERQRRIVEAKTDHLLKILRPSTPRSGRKGQEPR
jgi:DNA-binding transcriptional MerR regulator